MRLLRPLGLVAITLLLGPGIQAQPALAPWPESYIRRGPPDLRLGPGDVVIVTIYEAGPGGLFTRPGGNAAGPFVQLPPQQVGPDGAIKVPYAGSLRAAGHRIRDLEAAIEDRLRARAVEPQVVITLQERRSGRTTLLGGAMAGQDEIQAASRDAAVGH